LPVTMLRWAFVTSRWRDVFRRAAGHLFVARDPSL
jgi:hypothetical protein